MKKPLKVLALLYNQRTNSISPHTKFLDPENEMESLREVLDCEVVTCTQIQVEGKKFDVYSDDEALLSEKPIPNLYISDDLILFGNLIFAKSGDNGEMIGLNHYEIQLLWNFILNQFPKLKNYLGRF